MVLMTLGTVNGMASFKELVLEHLQVAMAIVWPLAAAVFLFSCSKVPEKPITSGERNGRYIDMLKPRAGKTIREDREPLDNPFMVVLEIVGRIAIVIFGYCILFASMMICESYSRWLLCDSDCYEAA